MSAEALHDLPSFARGYLLASAWAAPAPAPAPPESTAGAKDRVTPLARTAIDEAMQSFAALSPAEQADLRREWLVSEPERRLEPPLDLHWSWLPDLLEDEPPALLVLLLHSIPPESAKEALRAMWTRLRSIPSRELEAVAPSEAWMTALRRHFFARFTLLSAVAPRALQPLLHLGRRELHLFLQESGLEEIMQAGGGDLPPDLAQMFDAFDGVDATRVRRLLKRTDEGEAGRRDLARVHLRKALSAAGPGGDLVGLVALDHVAAILGGAPRQEAVFLAQRLQREQGKLLIEWRDAWAKTGLAEAETLRAELLRRLATVISRSVVPTVANRVWA